MSETAYVETVTAYRELVKAAGGIFVEVRGNSVLFKSDVHGRTLTLYTFACRSTEDVQLAMKADREQDRQFSAWEKAG